MSRRNHWPCTLHLISSNIRGTHWRPALKSECRSNNLSVHHLNTTQEEADKRMLLHAIDATERGAASLCIQSPDTDVLVRALWKCSKSLRRNFPSSWYRSQVSINPTGSSVQCCRGSCSSGITRISRISRKKTMNKFWKHLQCLETLCTLKIACLVCLSWQRPWGSCFIDCT